MLTKQLNKTLNLQPTQHTFLNNDYDSYSTTIFYVIHINLLSTASLR